MLRVNSPIYGEIIIALNGNIIYEKSKQSFTISFSMQIVGT